MLNLSIKESVRSLRYCLLFPFTSIDSFLKAERKSVKALGATHYTSPMKFIQKTLSNASNTSLTGNKSKEFVRVKLEVADSKHRKDLEGLKKSYQRYSTIGNFSLIL